MSEILSRIADRHPLSSEHAEDGRYTWPERWNEAHDEIAALEAKLEAMSQVIEVVRAVLPNMIAKGPLSEASRLDFALQEFDAAQEEKEDE